MLEDSSAWASKKKWCTMRSVFAPCARMDAENGCKNGSKHLERLWYPIFLSDAGLVPYLWCFNCAAFHFVTLPNHHPSATSVPTPCHSVRPWNPLSTNAWPVWEQLGDSEKCCDGFSWKLKGRCQMLMQYCCIDIVYPILKHCCMIWHAVFWLYIN